MSDKDQTQVSTATDAGDAGYNKALKNRHIQMIAIGGSIGTGLFLGAGGRLAQGGPALAFAYAVCGVFAFLMVRALGELAVRRPSSGAFVSYAREFLGEKGAFITGWFFFLDWAVTVMADITAVALYMHYWTMFEAIPQWVIALIALALVFVLNMLSVKAFGEAEFWFAMIKVATILPKAINSMVIRIFFFYVGSVVLFALALPYNAYSSNESPFTTFFSGIGVPHAGDIMQVVVLTAALSSLNAGLYATGRTLRSMALVGEGPRYAARLNKNHVPYGGIIITASLGLLGVLLNAFVPQDAFNIVMDLAGIGIAGTWAMILISHLAFLRKVKRGEAQRPEFRMPGAPYTNYLALLFFAVVVGSNVTSESGRWTLALFAVVVVLMVAGWYYVRGRVGNLTDEAAASLQGDETLVSGD